jgi:hypothetical protein
MKAFSLSVNLSGSSTVSPSHNRYGSAQTSLKLEAFADLPKCIFLQKFIIVPH